MMIRALSILLATTASVSSFTISPSKFDTTLKSVTSYEYSTLQKVANTRSSFNTKLFMADATETMSIDDIAEELRQHKVDFDRKIAIATSVSEAEAIRVEYLGKKGPINKVMSYMRLLSAEDKPKLGSVVNEIKQALEEVIVVRKDQLVIEEIERQLENEKIDVTLPGLSSKIDIGRRHPLSITMQRAVDIFVSLGYDTVTSCVDSPEIETDYNCFEALNCPKDHPARDMQDTFYLTEDLGTLLRTHTSAVQIRQLEKRKPPLRIVAPGRVYRKDDIDATHSMIFHQIEILALDEIGKLNLGHLKGTVEYFLKQMFGPDIKVRFRGSYFPFTEPSMEVDVFFRGKWLEVLGCGMVDPNVLTMAGLDPTKISGFAAGFGVERFAMVIHEINDIREFYKNDKRFLDQFPHFYDSGINSLLSGKSKKNDTVQESAAVTTPPTNAVAETAKAPQEQNPKKGNTPTTVDEIDISKLDLRVGVITKAWIHEEADKLFCEEIDLGEESGPRQIASGLRQYYKLEELEGQRVIVLANLKARKLAGFSSHGMVLCASSEDGSKVEFIEPPAEAKIGERLMCEGFDGEPATENQILKKKMLDKIFPDLKTNGDGVVTFKGIPLTTTSGPCIAKNKMPNSLVG